MLVFTFKSDADFKKRQRFFFLLTLARLPFVVLGLISYQCTMKLICSGFFFFFLWRPYRSTRLRMWLTLGYGQPWKTPTPSGSWCWCDWFVLICINVFCCECDCMFFVCLFGFLLWQIATLNDFIQSNLTRVANVKCIPPKINLQKHLMCSGQSHDRYRWIGYMLAAHRKIYVVQTAHDIYTCCWNNSNLWAYKREFEYVCTVKKVSSAS